MPDYQTFLRPLLCLPMRRICAAPVRLGASFLDVGVSGVRREPVSLDLGRWPLGRGPDFREVGSSGLAWLRPAGEGPFSWISAAG
ncbi:hypothetical protein, partial [Paractinoplanes durhamensis]